MTPRRADGRDHLVLHGFLPRSHHIAAHSFRWLDPGTLRIDLKTARRRDPFKRPPPSHDAVAEGWRSRDPDQRVIDRDFLEPRRPEPVNSSPYTPRELVIDLGPATKRSVSVRVYMDGQIEHKGRLHLG